MSRHLPDIPTMKELGYDMDYCIESWWFAPKGTPQEAIDGMAAALEKARHDRPDHQVLRFEDVRPGLPLGRRPEAVA
ncbi:MAG: hypothetical protein AcusKO_19970 [Acuticoccus sp.]